MGVSYDKKCKSWIATWQDAEGNKCSKSYSMKKYGGAEAKAMAVEYCQRMIWSPPNQYLLYRGDVKCYFPKNDLSEGSATAEIGKSFSGAYRHKNARLNRVNTKASDQNPNNKQFPTSSLGRSVVP